MTPLKFLLSEPSGSFLNIPCYVKNLSRVWESVLYLGERHFFSKGKTFKLGKNKNIFGYINKGLTCSYAYSNVNHSEEIIFFIDEGCLIKEAFVHTNYDNYLTCHRCLSDVEVFLFSRDLLNNADFNLSHSDLIKNYIFSLSVKGISSQIFSSIMKLKSAYQKIAIFLYGFYLFSDKKTLFTPPFGQKYLGSLLGLTKFTVNRVIHSMIEEKIIEKYTSKNITLLDPDRLVKRCRDEEMAPF